MPKVIRRKIKTPSPQTPTLESPSTKSHKSNSSPTKPAALKKSRPTSGLLSRATEEVQQQPISMILYGPPGCGKSSMAAYMPDPLFIIHPKERGIKNLIAKKLVHKIPTIEIETWEEKLELFSELGRGDHPYKSVIEDSMTWVEQQCFNACCHDLFDDDKSNTEGGFYNYWRGPIKAAQWYWPLYLDKLLAISEAGINICLIAHARLKQITNPEGQDYVSWQPKLENQSWEILHAWADMVLFINRSIDVEKESKMGKGKGSGGTRFLETDWSPAFAAKSKGLPPIIEMGDSGKEAWANLFDAYNNPVQ